MEEYRGMVEWKFSGPVKIGRDGLIDRVGSCVKLGARSGLTGSLLAGVTNREEIHSFLNF